MTVCGGWSLIKHSGYATRAITLFCRSWQCADCAPRRLSGLKAMALSGNPTTFLTLTVNPAHGQDATSRAQELSDAMKILIKRARRKFTKSPIEYMAVFEETTKGEPHLHMLLRAPYVPQKWISRTMDELINAPVVDIRRVGSKRGVAKYVAKYVAKGPRAFGQLKRYWASKGYDARPEHEHRKKSKGDSGWRVVMEPLFILYDQWKGMGFDVAWEGENEIVNPHTRWGPFNVFLLQKEH